MKKGIIMEIRRDVLVMMTPDGQFMNGKKTPNKQYSVGEEIPFHPVKKDRRVIEKRNWKAAASILTAAILMITLFSTSFLQSDKAYAYVSVDINPSLELSLDREQQVIAITPYNEDGKVLIKKLEDWKNEEVSDVAEEILRLSEKLGYLKKGQNVWITSTLTELAEDETYSALLNELHDFTNEYNNLHPTEIIVNETTTDIREEAVEKGMTAGTLLKEKGKRDKKIIVNPDENIEEPAVKKEKEVIKPENPAVSNQSDEKEEANDGKQNNAASIEKRKNEVGNGNNAEKNRGSQGNNTSNRNTSSQKERSESDNRSHDNKRDTNNRSSDKHREKNSKNEDKSNRSDNKNHGNGYDTDIPRKKGNEN
ncbi:anti-sigma factor domain-containing protein [Bacillus sp. Marseille-Q1617]|uniref:anti-sigma factor domain-containing protein n=1 Tax=Bacillus sp. Marseille-Q1617 TaxID=2736887 RepID=UPI00158B8B6F|nr:anti-sigma factor domain-containing protein [Bacillus sp. Marseille-Q1617]